MKKYLRVFFAVVCCMSFIQCSDDPTPTIIPDAPTINVLRGDSQKGMADRQLPEDILFEIRPSDSSDIDKYVLLWNSYNLYTHIEISDDIIYVHVKWSPSFNSGDTDELVLSVYYVEDQITPSDLNDLEPLAIKIVTASRVDGWVVVHKAYDDYTMGPGDYFDIHFSDQFNGVVMGDFSDGVAITDDGGESWSTFILSPYESWWSVSIFKMAFYNNLHGIVIGTNNYAYRTENGGKSISSIEGWTPPITGHQSSMDYYMKDAMTIISVGNRGSIAKSVDGGKTWSKCSGFDRENTLNSICFLSDDIGFICGDIGVILRTQDGGDSWQEITSLKLNNNLYNAYSYDGRTIFVAGSDGIILRTSDMGETWTKINTSLTNSVIEIKFFSETMGYVVSNCGEIAKTEDGGNSWSIVCPAYWTTHHYINLTRVLFKDEETIFGLSGQVVFRIKP